MCSFSLIVYVNILNKSLFYTTESFTTLDQAKGLDVKLCTFHLNAL